MDGVQGRRARIYRPDLHRSHLLLRVYLWSVQLSLNRICLHLLSPLQGLFSIHPPGASQVHIARLAAFAPGGHPVGIGLGALPVLFDLLHLPQMQVLKSGLELEGLGLCQGLICFFL